MEDPHHNLFFSACESPSIDGLFEADKPSAMTNLPPATAEITDGGVNNTVDFNSLWLSFSDEDNQPGGFEAGPSGTCGDKDKEQGKYCAPVNIGTSSLERNSDELIQLLPAPTVPFNCSFCQVLREIIHVHNDNKKYMKLEIHGMIGVISHAILETKMDNAMTNGTSDNNAQFEMLDFSSMSTAEVKQLLTNYCLQRSQEGYIMANDPLSKFYEALSVGLSPQPIFQTPDFIAPPREGRQEEHEPRQQGEVEEATRRRTRRVSLAAQRKRTARLTLMYLREVFHLPLVEAAKKMQVCSTVLKKICRRGGIDRWPFRKLDSVKKKIAELEQNLNSSDAESKAQAEDKINALRQEAMDACGGINIL